MLGLGPFYTVSTRSASVFIRLWVVDSCVWSVSDISRSMSFSSAVSQTRSAGGGAPITAWTSSAAARRAVMPLLA